MNMALYEPWRVFDQFNQILNQMGQTTQNDSNIATSTWMPLVDIKEETHQFVIEADIPGVDPKDIEISMEHNVLTIKGERRLENQVVNENYSSDNYKRIERLHGNFHRRFSLPETADAEKISATGKNGVLQVTIPKKEVAKPRKITVQS